MKRPKILLGLIPILGLLGACSGGGGGSQTGVSVFQVTGVADDSVPTRSKTWTWASNRTDSLFRYVINQEADYEFDAGDPFDSTITATQGSGDGTYYLHVQAQDENGDLSEVFSFSAILDNSALAPLRSALGQEQRGADRTPEITVSGVEPYAVITLYNDSACEEDDEIVSGVTVSEGETSTAIQLPTELANAEAIHSFYARQVDRLGNESDCSEAIIYILDLGDPLALAGLANDTSPTQSKSWSWALSGEGVTYNHRYVVNQNTTHSFQGTEASVGGTNGTASQASGDGTYYLHVRAESGGIYVQQVVSAVLDNTTATPTVALASGTATQSDDQTPTLTISSLEEGATITIHSDSSCSSSSLGEATVNEGETSISVTTNDLGNSDASFTFYAKQEDTAGNTACSSSGASYILEVAPFLAVTGLTDDTTATNSKTWSWGGSGGSGYTYRHAVNQSATHSFSGAYDSTATATQNTGNGTYYLHVEVKSSTGALATRTVSAVIDTVASTPTLVLSGANAQDDDLTPTVAVSNLEGGATATLYSDSSCSTSLASGTVPSGQTSLNLTVSALAENDATYNFYANQTDTAGNTSSCSTGVQYILDVSPLMMITGIADDTTATRSKSWTWTASGSAGITYRHAVNQSATHTFSGAYNSTVTATQNTGDGTYYLHVEAKGSAGPIATKTVSAVLDNSSAVPTLALGSGLDAVDSDTTPSFIASGLESGATVNLYTASACTTSVGSATVGAGENSVTVTVSSALASDGAYSFYAKQTDALGNPSACTASGLSYTLDTQANAPSGLALASGVSSPSNDRTPTITVSGLEGGATATLYSDSSCSSDNSLGEATAGASDTTVDVTTNSISTDGTYTIYAKQTDPVDNESSCSTATVSYTLDTQAATPTLAFATGSGTPGNDLTPTITASGVESQAVVTLYSDSSCTTSVGTGTVASGETSVDITASSISGGDGDYSFYAKQVDPYNNPSACSQALTYTLDRTPPDAPSGIALASGVASPSDDTTPSFTVSGVEALATVTLYTNASCGSDSAGGNATVGSGATTVDVTVSPALVSEGRYTYYAAQVDSAGNPSLCSTANLNYDLNIPPAVTGLADDSTPTQHKAWTWSALGGTNFQYRYKINNQSSSYSFTDATEPYGDVTLAVGTSAIGTGSYYIHVQAKDTDTNEESAVETASVTFMTETEFKNANILKGLILGDNLKKSSSAFLIDLDNDGDDDIVSGNFDGNVYYYENEGSASEHDFQAKTGSDNPFNGINVGTYSKPILADMDDDSDYDLVMGKNDGTLAYHENTGSASSPSFSTTAESGSDDPFNGIDAGDKAAPALADFDGDDDFDLAIGGADGVTKYYENDGSATDADFDTTAETGNNDPFNGIDVGDNAVPSPVDIDNDGLIDVFFGEYNDEVSYYENTGSASSPTLTERTGANNPLNGSIVPSGEGTISFANLDGESGFEAVIGSSAGGLGYYLNTGSNTSPTFVEQSRFSPLFNIDVGNSAQSRFVDLDNDGDLDLVGGDTDGSIRYFENTGSSTAPVFTGRTGASNPFNGIDANDAGNYSPFPAFGDLDADGKVDVLFGRGDGTILYYRNTGSSPSLPAFTVQNGASNPANGFDVGNVAAPVLVDVNNDDDLDLFVGDRDGSIFYYENTGSAGSPAFTARTGSNNPLNGETIGNPAPTAIDLDNDGDFDFVFGKSSSGADVNFSYYENTGSNSSPAFTERTGASNPLNGIRMSSASLSYFDHGDIDGDGDVDIFLIDINGLLRYGLNFDGNHPGKYIFFR